MCLEYGPDNWHPDITGAMMIESAQRLLLGEALTGGAQGIVASRHATSLGQNLRSAYSRLLATKPLTDFLARVPERQLLAAKAIVVYSKESAVLVLATVTESGGAVWEDAAVPARLKELFPERSALLVRFPSEAALPGAATAEDLLREIGAERPSFTGTELVVVVRGDQLWVYRLWDDKTVTSAALVPAADESVRLDEDHLALSGRKVGLVGCGSLGSKIAVMLSRSGVGKFLLVDDDVFLPANLVRHDLDWRDVGTHKVRAVASRIQLVNAAVQCETRSHRLGGQEASGGVETLIDSLAGCDLVVDATADAAVFGYLCAAAAIGKKPLMWAEVFGGGFGGLIARSRPGLDPDPASVKAIIEAWCQERGLPLERATDYGGGTPERPLIADDADVTVIAAHGARFALDILIPRQPSLFPHSAYMIGLANRWLFGQPFETYPISVGVPPASRQSESPSDAAVSSQERRRIIELFAKQADAVAPPSGDP